MKKLLIVLLLLVASQCFSFDMYLVCKYNADSTFTVVGTAFTDAQLTSLIWQVKLIGTACDSFTVDTFSQTHYIDPPGTVPRPTPLYINSKMYTTDYWHICETMIMP